MKAIILAATLFVAGAASSQNIAGVWEGKLAVPGGPTLRIVFNIKAEGSGYGATLDSPDQGAKGIATGGVAVTNDSLRVEIPLVGGRFLGKRTTDTTINGAWVQGARLPLDLKKVQTASVVKRPQTPVGPFDYAVEDVLYYNQDSSIRYGATLTTPKGKGPFATLLFITGSGQQNRDEELFGHKPFAVLAHHLTQKGYAVLRVDDRGTGQTTGDAANATSADFAGDVTVGLNYLKGRPEVNKSKIGLLGHSEGGMIAQIVGSQRSDVAFVISLAGPGQNILDLLADQNKALLQSMGIDKSAAAAYAPLFASLMPVVAAPDTDSAAKAAGLPVLQAWLQKTPDSLQAAYVAMNPSKKPEDYLSGMLKQVRSPWFRYFIHYNPEPHIRTMKGKVLVLNGSEDVQVASKPNLEGWRNNLRRSKATSWEAMELPGLNHLFQHCKTCTVAEYGTLEETFAPEAMKVISDWLNKNVK